MEKTSPFVAGLSFLGCPLSGGTPILLHLQELSVFLLYEAPVIRILLRKMPVICTGKLISAHEKQIFSKAIDNTSLSVKSQDYFSQNMRIAFVRFFQKCKIYLSSKCRKRSEIRLFRQIMMYYPYIGMSTGGYPVRVHSPTTGYREPKACDMPSKKAAPLVLQPQ